VNFPGIAPCEFLFYDHPEVATLFNQVPVQSKPFFHDTFDIIAFDRIAYFPVDRNGESMKRQIIFYIVKKKKPFRIFLPFFIRSLKSSSWFSRW